MLNLPIYTLISLLIISLYPAIFWLVVYYKKDFLQPEPHRLIVQTFLIGMLGATPLVALQFLTFFYPVLNPASLFYRYVPNFLLAAVLFYTFAALVEEYLKASGILYMAEKHQSDFNQIVDGIIYAVSAALGFAFVENFAYFVTVYQNFGPGRELLTVVLIRSSGATLAHSVFSGIFGFMYAKAKLKPYIFKSAEYRLRLLGKTVLKAFKFHILRSHFLPRRPSAHGHSEEEVIAEGFLLAILLHTVYNVLVSIKFQGYNLAYFSAPLVILGFTYLSYVFTRRGNTRIVKRVRKKLIYDYLCLPEKRYYLKSGGTIEQWYNQFDQTFK